ncbi:MAG: hypothetical protein LBE78_02295 [Burkholderiaceae bacterium]|jgi:phospholipase/lecithinase/hemolysin|nr:hypothetical protein [Burkholderiaceae bacterium]
MNIAPSRRNFLLLAGAGATVALAGCGSSSVASAIKPQHIYVVGDGFCDVGQTGAVATVNDGSLTWVQALAAEYGLTVEPANKGGTGYAQVYARIDSPDTTSGTNAPSVKQQIDQLLADVTAFENDDLIIINGGMHDIIDAFNANGISDTTTAIVKAAGQALSAQVKRLRDAGVKHVCVAGTYSLSITPWGRATGFGSEGEGLDDNSPLNKLTNDFNGALKIATQSWSATVLLVEPAGMFNDIANHLESYGIDESLTPVCTTPTALTCTASTVKDADYNRYLFADDLHFTPAVLRLYASDNNYGNNIYSKLKQRW